ncbi:MFS transporter [Lacrimispora sp.]|uniref:MFS transporter n=1 Tax=Lacrimispora sp. TaxID=2719234 RepID=UPI0028AE364B|nr:MFS transporter [Lacrimispora sp.]
MVIVFWCVALCFYSTSFAAYSALLPDQVEENRRGTVSGLVGLFNPLGILFGMMVLTALNNLSLTMKFGAVAGASVLGALIASILIKDEPIDQYKTSEKKSGKIYPSLRAYPAFTWAFLTRFLVCTAFASQVYATLFFMQKFNISQEQVTGIATLNSLIQTIGLGFSATVGGMLSDKFRKQKPFISVAAVLVAVGVFTIAVAPSLPIVFIGTAILGIGYGSYIAVDMGLIARILPNKKDAAKDLGIMNIAGQLPQSLVPVIANPLITAGGFTLFYSILAFAGLLGVAAVVPIPEVPKESEQEKTT